MFRRHYLREHLIDDLVNIVFKYDPYNTFHVYSEIIGIVDDTIYTANAWDMDFIYKAKQCRIVHVKDNWMLVTGVYDKQFKAHIWNRNTKIQLLHATQARVHHEHVVYIRKGNLYQLNPQSFKHQILELNAEKIISVGSTLNVMDANGFTRIVGSVNKLKCFGMYEWQNKVYIIHDKRLEFQKFKYDLEFKVRHVLSFGSLLIIRCKPITYVWHLDTHKVQEWDLDCEYAIQDKQRLYCVRRNEITRVE